MSHDKHGDFVEFVPYCVHTGPQRHNRKYATLNGKDASVQKKAGTSVYPRFPDTRRYKSKVITIVQLAMHVEIGCE